MHLLWLSSLTGGWGSSRQPGPKKTRGKTRPVHSPHARPGWWCKNQNGQVPKIVLKQRHVKNKPTKHIWSNYLIYYIHKYTYIYITYTYYIYRSIMCLWPISAYILLQLPHQKAPLGTHLQCKVQLALGQRHRHWEPGRCQDFSRLLGSGCPVGS